MVLIEQTCQCISSVSLISAPKNPDIKMLYYFNYAIQNFKLNNGIEEWSNKDYPEKVTNIDDDGFRIFLKQENDGRDFGAYCQASIFYSATCGKRGKIILDYKYFEDNIKLVKKFEMALNSTRIVGNNRYKINDKRNYFIEQFAFVHELSLLEGRVYDWSGGLGGQYVYGPKAGLALSFLSVKNLNEELLRFYYDDIRSLEEIQNISEYTVKPISL